MLRLSCVALLLVATLSANAAVNIFMGIGGAPGSMTATQPVPALPGESTDVKYPQWNPLLSVSNGISLPVSLTGGSGTGTGTSIHSDITITKLADKTTPALNLLVNGASSGTGVALPIDYVTIDFRDTTSSIVFYRLVLEGVFVTSVTTGGAGDVITETITLKYQKIRWTYQPYSGSKTSGASITKGWDVTAGKAY